MQAVSQQLFNGLIMIILVLFGSGVTILAMVDSKHPVGIALVCISILVPFFIILGVIYFRRRMMADKVNPSKTGLADDIMDSEGTRLLSMNGFPGFIP